jgi:hypothetical protein
LAQNSELDKFSLTCPVLDQAAVSWFYCNFGRAEAVSHSITVATRLPRGQSQRSANKIDTLNGPFVAWRNRSSKVYVCGCNDMKKFILLLAMIFAIAVLTPTKAQAGVFFPFGLPIPVPVPVFYGPTYPSYSYGPYGYAHYPRPYWRHRYWSHGRWYYN